jgi:muramoyltetrapeptide carboxypeptidase
MPGVDLWKDEPDAFAAASLFGEVTGTRPNGPLTIPTDTGKMDVLRPGSAEGWLFPANLTLLANLCGTPWMPDPTGAILVIEEIGEEAYRVDRLLSQLWNAGVLGSIAGLVFGAFTGTEPKRISIDPLPIEEVFAEYVQRADVPTLAGLPYGHIQSKLTLPVGVSARVDAEGGELHIMESGVA